MRQWPQYQYPAEFVASTNLNRRSPYVAYTGWKLANSRTSIIIVVSMYSWSSRPWLFHGKIHTFLRFWLYLSGNVSSLSSRHWKAPSAHHHSVPVSQGMETRAVTDSEGVSRLCVRLKPRHVHMLTKWTRAAYHAMRVIPYRCVPQTVSSQRYKWVNVVVLPSWMCLAANFPSSVFSWLMSLWFSIFYFPLHWRIDSRLSRPSSYEFYDLMP